MEVLDCMVPIQMKRNGKSKRGVFGVGKSVCTVN
jgi:hypothetical protein